ncbi:hypothetical protein TONV_093 [Tipula oleracea nudivirus]|uniref:Uncharacterized protein n=1 Tax=Tipula oleracea nudivirus TaxID=1546257 RepID=A0A0B4VGT4_9VIRU|nr:hypothetical protein TONV_093 [Tipula oleracea nudivirus]AJD20153.1 hypothetical protein TONV_093 [Tipula oleracea nudivirus]
MQFIVCNSDRNKDFNFLLFSHITFNVLYVILQIFNCFSSGKPFLNNDCSLNWSC